MIPYRLSVLSQPLGVLSLLPARTWAPSWQNACALQASRLIQERDRDSRICTKTGTVRMKGKDTAWSFAHETTHTVQRLTGLGQGEQRDREGWLIASSSSRLMEASFSQSQSTAGRSDMGWGGADGIMGWLILISNLIDLESPWKQTCGQICEVVSRLS